MEPKCYHHDHGRLVGVLQVNSTTMPTPAPIDSPDPIQLTHSGVTYPNIGYAHYVVASPEHARRLFSNPGMGNVLAACIEMTTESGGACVVKLTANHRGGYYDVQRLNNPADVTECDYSPCLNALHEVGHLDLVKSTGVDTFSRSGVIS